MKSMFCVFCIFFCMFAISSAMSGSFSMLAMILGMKNIMMPLKSIMSTTSPRPEVVTMACIGIIRSPWISRQRRADQADPPL